MKINNDKKIGLGLAIICTACIFLVYAAMYFLIYRESVFVESEYQKLINGENIKKETEAYNKLNESNKNLFQKINSKYSIGNDTVVIIDELEKFASSKKLVLSIENINNGPRGDSTENMISVSLSLRGDRDNLFNFFRDIGSFSYMVDVDKLKFARVEEEKVVSWVANAEIYIPILNNEN